MWREYESGGRHFLIRSGAAGKESEEKRSADNEDIYRRHGMDDPAGERAVLIWLVDEHEKDLLEQEYQMIRGLCGPAVDENAFAMIAVLVNDWNRELSPWTAPAVFGNEDFGEGAGETLAFILDKVIPEESRQPEETEKLKEKSGTSDYIGAGRSQGVRYFLGGYSLAGLFSLWAAYQTDVFSGIAAVSPSVWFPGWPEYAGSHEVKVSSVYLSLGDREEKTKNPVMRRVGDNIRRQKELLEDSANCRECVLEWNEGNHFKEPELRMAKGFAWLINKNKEC